MPIDQSDEIGGSVTAECGLGEMGVGRQIIVGGCPDVREIAAATAGNHDLPARLRRVIDQQDPAAPLPGKCRTEHSGGPGPDNDCVIQTGSRNGPEPYAASGTVRNGWKVDIRMEKTGASSPASS